jgi:hypothetical protein
MRGNWTYLLCHDGASSTPSTWASWPGETPKLNGTLLGVVEEGGGACPIDRDMALCWGILM